MQRGTDLLNVPATDDAVKLAERYGGRTIARHDLTLSVVPENLGVPVRTFDADLASWARQSGGGRECTHLTRFGLLSNYT